jgi:hypothetical protein
MVAILHYTLAGLRSGFVVRTDDPQLAFRRFAQPSDDA